MNNDEICICTHTYEVHFGGACSKLNCRCKQFVLLDLAVDLFEELKKCRKELLGASAYLTTCDPVTIKMKIQIQVPSPPAELLARLERQVQKYTDANYLYHCIWLDSDNYCGVFGDGPNACYEWFIWRGKLGELQTSNVGYGDSTVALRDVLAKVA